MGKKKKNKVEMVSPEDFCRMLIIKRAARPPSSFINDRGFRHISNFGDKTGASYAYWKIRKKGV